MRRAAPDPADEPGAGPVPARGGRRHGGSGTGTTGRPRGATGTDTPPEPLIDARAGGATPTAPFYPAQRRREDTWPPPSAEPPSGHTSTPPNGHTRTGRPPGGRPTPPMGVPQPDPRAPAPRSNGTGPLPPVPPDVPLPSDLADPTSVVPMQPPGDPTATLAGPAPLPEDVGSGESAEPADDELADDLPDDLPDDDGTTAEGWALVRAAQNGDTDAFGRLFDRYHDTVFRFVLFRLGDRPAAEDLTQETFVRAYRRITSVSYQGRDIGAWFVTIARNLVLDHVKSSRYRLESSTAEVADVAPSTFRAGPESEVIAGATHAELLRCVARLGDDQQECIALRFLQGLSVAETAEIMNRNEGAVKALQHRAVRRLAQLLPEGLR